MIRFKYTLYNLNEVNEVDWYLDCYKSLNDPHYSSFLQLRCSNYVDPWIDKLAHYHTISQEIYILLNGELWILINNKPFILREKNLLLIQPANSHQIIGGKDKIRHIVIKVPHQKDKWISQDSGLNYNKKVTLDFFKVDLRKSTGFFADLNRRDFQNNWLLGYDEALYQTKHICLAYVNLRNYDDYKEVNHHDIYHYHLASSEWYFTIKGCQKLLLDKNEVVVYPGFLLRVPEKIPHKLLSYSYPFEGITLRTPALSKDKVTIKR